MDLESTALGAALMCAVSLGLIKEEDIPKLRKSERVFTPSKEREEFDRLYGEYKIGVERALL